MFDTSEVIEEKSEKNEDGSKGSKQAVVGSSSNSVPVQMSIEGDAIEMTTLRRHDDVSVSIPINTNDGKDIEVETTVKVVKLH